MTDDRGAWCARPDHPLGNRHRGRPFDQLTTQQPKIKRAADGTTAKVHIHDWHTTILHQLGLDHTKLTYRYAGRDMRLTDVKGEVVKDILA